MDTKPKKKTPEVPWPETRKRAKRIAQLKGMLVGKIFDDAIRMLEMQKDLK